VERPWFGSIQCTHVRVAAFRSTMENFLRRF
jgi:hypothetical protein